MPASGLRRWWQDGVIGPGFVLAALAAWVLPALVFGPWIPFVDLAAFVGMNAYPAGLSYGPAHYATFQFTYLGHYAISRFLTDLHVTVPWQILLFYAVQMGVAFVIVWRSLVRLMPERFAARLCVIAGVLCTWDGVFLWGGPLAYSLAGAFLAVAAFLTLREAHDAASGRASVLPLALCVLAALLCHPFAAPFALLVCGVRFLFVSRARLQTVAIAVGVIVYSYVIVRDSPASEASATGTLSLLFGVDPRQMARRITGLFTQDALFARALFGDVPLAMHLVFVLMAAVKGLGFIGAPFVAWRTKEQPFLRALATLAAVVGVLYLFARDLPTNPIPEWPQRILTIYSPFTYLMGVCTVAAAIRWLRHRRKPKPSARDPRPLQWAALAAVGLLVVLAQTGILRHGRTLEAVYEGTRDQLLATKIEDAHVVLAGADRIRPFFLRAVPFLLFSDPQVVARDLTLGTEWHFQARHPSRVTELVVNLGRPRYVGTFAVRNGALALDVTPFTEAGFPMITETNERRWGNPAALALDQFRQGTDLAAQGFLAAAVDHFNTAVRLQPQFAHAWNDAGAALVKAGQLEDGQTYFESAIKHDPQLVEAQVNMGAVLVARKRLDEAVPFLQRALELQPENEKARRLLRRIEAQGTVPAEGKSGE